MKVIATDKVIELCIWAYTQGQTDAFDAVKLIEKHKPSETKIREMFKAHIEASEVK